MALRLMPNSFAYVFSVAEGLAFTAILRLSSANAFLRLNCGFGARLPLCY